MLSAVEATVPKVIAQVWIGLISLGLALTSPVLTSLVWIAPVQIVLVWIALALTAQERTALV